MDTKLKTWILEVKSFNKRLHLVSAAMENAFENQVSNTLDLMKYISEPVIGDLGSGSGFLGIPYKVMNPDSQVFLIERSQKKCIFLRHIVDVLDLKGAEVIEADPLKQSIGPLPALMSRSFSPREKLLEAARRVLAHQGRFYFFSTGSPDRIKDPLFEAQEHISNDCAGYRLNLDRYLVTSR